jgi:uncharacterized membrane protein YfcA
VLGGFLVFDATAGFVEKSERRVTSPNRSKAILGGTLCGIAAGIIGTGGAIRAIFLHHFLRDKTAYIATSAVIGLCIDASRIPVYVTLYPAAATRGILPLIVATVSASLVGVLVAQHFLKYISTRQFQRVVLVTLIVAGVALIVQGLGEYSAREENKKKREAVYAEIHDRRSYVLYASCISVHSIEWQPPS